MKERAVRRRLHEQLQVLRGNIRVMVRVRPPAAGVRAVLGYPLDGLLSISPGDGRRYQEFEFDHVFSPEVGQGDVFAEVSPLVRSAADGYNVSPLSAAACSPACCRPAVLHAAACAPGLLGSLC